METTTIILLSVLSTLSVVAIITLVVVSFARLGRKVNTLEETFKRDLVQKDDETNTRLNQIVDEFHREFEDVKKFIDSRCDKLDAKIKTPNQETQKQVLQG